MNGRGEGEENKDEDSVSYVCIPGITDRRLDGHFSMGKQLHCSRLLERERERKKKQ